MIILGGMLLIAFIICLIQLIQFKRQIRSFTETVTKLNRPDYKKPVSVEMFDKDIIKLANALNRQIELRQELSAQYENDRRQIKNVIAGISHDFRTPLTAINGYMQMIGKNGNLSETDMEYLSIAIRKTSYLKSLSDDFFEVSSLEINDEEIEIAPININNVLSEIILGQYDWIISGGYRVEFYIPDEDIIIYTNEHYLIRIINNLFSNARKYALSFVGLKVSENENHVIITVKNDMENTDNIDSSRIFEPFYHRNQGNSSGSGLGLYVVKCLSDKLGLLAEADCKDGIFLIKIKCPIKKF